MQPRRQPWEPAGRCSQGAMGGRSRLWRQQRRQRPSRQRYVRLSGGTRQSVAVSLLSLGHPRPARSQGSPRSARSSRLRQQLLQAVQGQMAARARALAPLASPVGCGRSCCSSHRMGQATSSRSQGRPPASRHGACLPCPRTSSWLLSSPTFHPLRQASARQPAAAAAPAMAPPHPMEQASAGRRCCGWRRRGACWRIRPACSSARRPTSSRRQRQAAWRPAKRQKCSGCMALWLK